MDNGGKVYGWYIDTAGIDRRAVHKLPAQESYRGEWPYGCDHNSVPTSGAFQLLLCSSTTYEVW
ncbi:unnamed protein product [Ectocarpus sp. CCAP 1310/34]|nr:unnamed protein product [Ectocarpus sp. CCAP 1310/34]